METKGLEYFISVYDCRSITTAAEQLFISPQGLSKSIAHLEGELGQTLFVRSNRGVEPTAFAHQAYPVARKVVSLIDSIVASTSQSRPTEFVSIVSTSGYLLTLGMELWRSFELRENTRVHVEEAVDAAVADSVEKGLNDCGVISGAVDFGCFDATLVFRHPFVAVVNKDNPLARKQAIALEDLSHIPVSLMAPGFSAYTTIRNRFAQASVEPERFIGVQELSTGMGYAKRNEAVHITADFVARNHPSDKLVTLPFDDPEFTWDTHFITRAGFRPSEATLLLRDHVIAEVRRAFLGVPDTGPSA